MNPYSIPVSLDAGARKMVKNVLRRDSAWPYKNKEDKIPWSVISRKYALLGATARLVADPLVRNRGTVCGSLAHADPQGDWGSALLAARASAVVRGAGGERTVPVEELALAPFMTTLAPLAPMAEKN